MDADRQAIWFDLDNSPHVPLFAPIIRHYRDKGVKVIVTARDHAQTLELLKLSGIESGAAVIGRHYGRNKLSKIGGLMVRAAQLTSHIKRHNKGKQRIAVAVSHGSRSMVLAAKWLKIPALIMYDYEFTETTIFNRFSERVIVPDGIPDRILDKIGLPQEKRLKYPGIKEELYVRGFEPDSGYRSKLLKKHGIEETATSVVVLLRPPATTANYHSQASELVLDAILTRLLSANGVVTIIVPRTEQQAAEIKRRIANIGPVASNYSILDEAVNGLELASASDLVISGGGTMNREAALLGVPVYSIFAGRQGALDASMESDGTITFIRSKAEVEKIKLEQRSSGSGTVPANRLTDRVERFVIEQIDSFLL